MPLYPPLRTEFELGGDEVDELLHPAEECRLQIGVRAHCAQDVLPRAGNIGLILVGPPQRFADSVLPLNRARNSRPGGKAEAGRLYRLPDVDEGVTDHEEVCTIRPAECGLRDAALLRPGDQVIHQNADTTARCRPEFGEDGIQIVDPLQVFDDDALDAEVVAPDAFDQFRVVAAFDEDPARPRDTSGVVGDSDGTRSRTHRALLGEDRCAQLHRLTFQQEPRTEREDANGTVVVLELHPFALDAYDSTAESRCGLLDYEVPDCVNNRQWRWRTAAGISGQRIHAIAIRPEAISHPSRLSEEHPSLPHVGLDAALDRASARAYPPAHDPQP